ncbi:MAG: chromosomal replication initiator protein DnaA [Candidatus Harrisonbacteria bacterium]|nr:chromosomal replication initiator protein DnaA [Candidatus Harrisonbacteria bacterium]
MEHKQTVSPTTTALTPELLDNLDTLWEAALSEVEIKLSRPNFITWFKNTSLIDKEEHCARIALPNSFAKEWIENKYEKIVLGALRNLDDSITKIEFLVGNSKQLKSRKVRKKEALPLSDQPSFPEFKIDSETNLNPRYTFDSFIVGKSNELSHAAASAVTDSVGSRYNPLFIYGGVGLGKTHLIQAIGNEIKARHSGKLRVRYVSSEKFINDVVWAMRNKRMETIKEKYRQVDTLIIDDIQFIIGKARTEEEFFHTFNALYEQNKQIIISADKPPKFMPELAERLRSRFEGGMIVDISLPDYELRFSILKAKLEEKRVELPDDIIGVIATKIQKNFRELEGVLNRIIFYQTVKEAKITTSLAESIINEIIQEPLKNISPNALIKAVAEAFEVQIHDLTGQCRKKEVVQPRQIAMYLLRDLLSLSYPNIGDRMGKRDHTTAIYAYEKIAKEITKNQSLNQKVIMIKELINQE